MTNVRNSVEVTPLKLLTFCLSQVGNHLEAVFTTKMASQFWCFGQIISSFRKFHDADDKETLSAVLVHKHLAYIIPPSGKIEFPLYPVASQSLSFDRTTKWTPYVYYPSMELDELTYLVLLSSSISAFKRGNTFWSSAKALVSCTENVSAIATFNSNKSGHCYGEHLETLTFLAAMNASHRNGLGGIEFTEFLLNFVFEFDPDYDPSERSISILKTDQCLGKLSSLNIEVPFLAPEGCHFSEAFQRIPGVYTGSMKLVKNKESVDVVLSFLHPDRDGQDRPNLIFECKYHQKPLSSADVTKCFRKMWNRTKYPDSRKRSRNILILVCSLASFNLQAFEPAFNKLAMGNVLVFSLQRTDYVLSSKKIWDKIDASRPDRHTIMIILSIESLEFPVLKDLKHLIQKACTLASHSEEVEAKLAEIVKEQTESRRLEHEVTLRKKRRTNRYLMKRNQLNPMKNLL